ncbi:MAG TPA: TatD family hydrolase, partial [Salinimicrobium sp.]|nr:TatD family hydrolase [Salinimicrobium sp.]
MVLTDTHTHLYSDSFDEDREEMISRALKNNITRFFIPAIDASHAQAMYRLEENHSENVFLMMGLHPTSVKDDYKEELDFVRRELNRRKFYAVGEIGIDLHWDKSTLETQKNAFRDQIGMAKEHSLPIVIHCRNAFEEIFEILEEEKGEDLFGIFHCFTGTMEDAQRAISLNMKLGIRGV